jgi:CAAX protease family protein
MIPRVLGNSPLWLLILPAFVFLLLANFEEELGWRGYALPQIQARSGAVVGSLIVGVLWGVWHLPLFLDKDAIQGGIPFGWFMLSVISISVVMTWIYNNTAGSLLLATITHASTNLTTIVLPLQPPLTGQRRPLLIYFVLTAAAAIVVIAIGGLRRASKQT